MVVDVWLCELRDPGRHAGRAARITVDEQHWPEYCDQLLDLQFPLGNATFAPAMVVKTVPVELVDDVLEGKDAGVQDEPLQPER